MDFDQIRFGDGKAGDLNQETEFLTGRGRYTDDLRMPGLLHACFVRSDLAHGRILAIDTAAARALPGVRAVYTGADLAAAGLGTIPPIAVFNGRDGQPMRQAGIPVLADGRVRYVGEAVAMVVADTALAAVAAAEQVVVQIDPLPAVLTARAVFAGGTEPLHAHCADNIALDWSDGDEARLESVFAGAHHVESVVLEDPPIAGCAMEPRAAIGRWDPAAGRMTLVASTQGVAVVRKLLAEGVFRLPPDRIRVVTPDVGGGFGIKAQTYPEYAAVLFASRDLQAPVKWTATRLESFLSDTHGRNSSLQARMAFDADGRILGLSAQALVGIGAYTSTYVGIVGTNNTKNCLSSVYRIPHVHFRSRLCFTNAMPLGPYRGAGRPEAIYLIERLLDRAARRLGLDRTEIRRRNFIAPSEMPYQAPNGQRYDSGEFEQVMDKALALSDWRGFAARKAESRSRGLLRGIGICCFLEVAGGILEEPAEIRFADDGSVRLHVGAQAIGQGHLATLPGLVARWLGVTRDRVVLVAGDSDQVPGLVPTVASRSMMMSGSALRLACDEAIRRGTDVAAHLMEVPAADVAFEDGRFRVAGTDRAIALGELVARLAAGGLPDTLPTTLDNTARFVTPAMSFPNGCHVSEVEIDPATGAVRPIRHVAVDDVGVVLNPAVVEGQIIGGVAQGLGQVFGERLHYAEDGQLLTASFMDYAVPRADTMPEIVLGHHVTACRNNPLGVKGAGESGVAGAMPSAVSAVLDALAETGITELDLPLTAPRVWGAIHRVGS